MAEQRDQIESLCLLIMSSEKEEIKDDVQLVKEGESFS